MFRRIHRITRHIEDPDYRRALAVSFFFSMFFSFSSFVMPVYLSSVGLNGYEIGVLVSLYAAASLFVTFPAGVINDKWTIRLTMVAAFFCLSAFFFGIGLFESFVIYLPLFLIGGLGNSIGDISLKNLVFKTRAEGQEGRKFGTFTLVRFMAASLGLFIGGTLTFLVGFKLGFGLIGLLYLLVIPFVTFRSSAKYAVKLGHYKKDVIDAKVIFIGLIMFMFALHWGSERTAFGLFLKNGLGLDMFTFGIYNALALPFLGFTAFYFGRRIDAGKSRNLKMIFFGGVVLSGVSYIASTVPVLWFSFLMRLVHEAGDGMADIAVYFFIARLFHVERVGGGSGVMYTVMLIGQVASSLAFGPMGEIYGYHVPIIITGVTSVISGILLLAYAKVFRIGRAMPGRQPASN